MRYRLSKSAANDLSGIWDYTARTWGEAQAERYLNQLESRFLVLAAEPSIGHLRPEIQADYFVCREGKHLIFYRPYEDGIAIARILHERMDVASRLEEEPGLND